MRFTEVLLLTVAPVVTAFVVAPAGSAHVAQHRCVNLAPRGISAFASAPPSEPSRRDVVFPLKAAADETASDAAADADANEDEATEAPPAQKKEVDVDELVKTPAFLTKKAEVLRKQLAALEAEVAAAEAQAAVEWAEWGPQITRMQDEFAFVKMRIYNDTMEAGNDAKTRALQRILTVSDNFLRGFGAIKPATDAEQAVADRYRGIYDTMQESFAVLGMKEVEAVGQSFDYNCHEAVMREPHPEFEEDVVTRVLQPGYQLGDSLIRPAVVVVSQG